MRVLGIDPGLRNMGWGIVDVSGNKLSHIANGVCQSQGNDLATRLLSLFNQMETIIEQWQPTHAAVENTFVNKDSVNSLKLDNKQEPLPCWFQENSGLRYQNMLPTK